MMHNKLLFQLGIIILMLLGYFIVYKLLERKNKTVAHLFAWALILEVVVSPFRAIDSRLCSAVAFVSFFLLIFFCVRRCSHKLSRKYIFYSILAGFLALQLPLRIISWNLTLVSLPDAISHLMGIVAGYLFCVTNSWIKYIGATAFIVLYIALNTIGFDLWLQQINFGTLSCKINMSVPARLTVTNKTDSVISLNKMRGKYVLLDFWNSACGVCFRKFPHTQAVYEKYRTNPRFVFYAVNIRLERDTVHQAFAIADKRKWTFPVVLYQTRNAKTDSTLQTLGVRCVPTVMIMDPTGYFIFRGDIEHADQLLAKLLK